MKCGQVWCAVVLVCALPLVADAATRYVAHTGTDGPNCGVDAATACRSISQAIALANPGDTILVGPGRYGDLNRNGVLGDIPGEEIGSPGCSCVLSMNKNVIILSSAGAAVTVIDGRSMRVVQTVVVLSVGGEFGRPGKGFTVTATGRQNDTLQFDGHGIGINAADVMVRGNQVIFSHAFSTSQGRGIFIVNDAAIRIEGNQVMNWLFGIDVRVEGTATVVSKNQVMNNEWGIYARGGNIIGNVVSGNYVALEIHGPTTVSGNNVSTNRTGIRVNVAASAILTKNNIIGNFCGVENNQNGLGATNNFWGVATGPVTGPSTSPADRVCGVTAMTSPFATKPFKVTILKP